jgi:hypothetical protein
MKSTTDSARCLNFEGSGCENASKQSVLALLAGNRAKRGRFAYFRAGTQYVLW